MKILCRYNHVLDTNDLKGMQWGREREKGEGEKFGDLKGILTFMCEYFLIWSECTDLGIRKKNTENSLGSFI